MSTTVQNQATVIQPSKIESLSPAAKTAWTVNFSTPAPQPMAAERLKARAELVRNALCTGSY